ncbi:hypothetical protein ElyMa_000845200 [Elysia marginata]|uniref:Uncharacterized protein n=1 Tax=Elysia marginata TaxID=1093978 RepID=A0AAV4H1C2_9GAST|nr:hypothetical protein ElyMa_000845200 [Elysia marginata]
MQKQKEASLVFSKNCPAYYRWCVTRHSRASYVYATNAMDGVNNDSNVCLKDISPFNIIQSEKLAEKAISAYAGFVNPFEVDGGLICLSSGQPVPDDLATNLVSVQHQGEQEFHNFVEKRLQSKVVSFDDPIKKKKMTTFSCMNKQKNKKSNEFKRIKVTAQRNMFGQLLMVSQSNTRHRFG